MVPCHNISVLIYLPRKHVQPRVALTGWGGSYVPRKTNHLCEALVRNILDVIPKLMELLLLVDCISTKETSEETYGTISLESLTVTNEKSDIVEINNGRNNPRQISKMKI